MLALQSPLLVLALTTQSTASDDAGGFWQLTDVHVDLLKECSGTEAKGWFGSFEGEYGCGCSVETVNATADFMVATQSAPNFILFTGDATASGDIIDNLEIIRGSVEKHFPSTPLYLVLGNHDFPGSPVGPAASSWYKQVADTWGSRWLDSAALDDFRHLGYYSTVPFDGNPALRLVILNTELFNHGNDHVVAGETVNEALAHLEWLNTTLASVKAAGQRAYVLGHVPIGMETAYGNDRRVPSVLRPYWMDLFARRYQDIIDTYGAPLWPLCRLLYHIFAVTCTITTGVRANSLTELFDTRRRGCCRRPDFRA
eukprot:COSAG02_NODE_2857_length_7888_cov_4.283220_5_plen_313_part_00